MPLCNFILQLRQTAVAAALTLLLTVRASAADAPDRWAGIEIGSTGVKIVILDARTDAAGTRFDEVASKDLPGNITANIMKVDGASEFAADAIDRTTEAVKELREFARTEHKVPDEHIYVVASSGVAQVKAKNLDVLRDKVGKLFQGGTKEVEVITPELEVRYTFLGVVPAADRLDAILIDIGGGNTKFGYAIVVDGQDKTAFGAVPFGSSTLASAVQVKADNMPEFIKAVEGVRAAKVLPALKAEAAKLQHRPKIYLAGGASWAFCVLENIWKGAAEAPRVEPGALARFSERVRDEQLDRYAVRTKEPSKWQTDEVQRVRKVFPPPRLVTASEMLKTVDEVFGLEKKENLVYFAPNSHLTWIRGFVEAKRRPPAAQPRIEPKSLPGTTDRLPLLIEELKAEIAKGRYPAELDKRLQDISDSLKDVSKQLAEMAKRPQPTPAVDMSELLIEIRKLREAVEKRPAPRAPAPVAPSNSTSGSTSEAPIDSNRGQVQFARALEHYQKGQFKESLALFEEATKANAREPSFWYGLTLAQHQLGMKDAAKATARQIATTWKRNPSTAPIVARVFERIQGADRAAVNGYIQKALDDILAEPAAGEGAASAPRSRR